MMRLETGNLSVSFQLLFPFPVRIGNGQAGVMCRNSGTCLLFLGCFSSFSGATPMVYWR